jgi:hypothetical protein
MVIAGAGLTAVGGFLMYLTRPVKQPGSGTTWTDHSSQFSR